jgi:predicted ATPase
MWPWRQALGGYADVVGEDVGEELLFLLYEQIVAHLKQVSARQPVLLVLDDLQWADTTSLRAFAHVAARLPDGVMLAGALRDRAPTPPAELTRTLASVSRRNEHVRIRLHPLEPGEIGELLRQETGRHPRPDTIRQIHARTAGNPFLAVELIRSGGPAGPPSVRDVVQARTAALDDRSRDLLEAAALLDRPLDVRLLAHAADLTVATCLDRLESLLAAGFLELPAGPPLQVRFEPDLVREAVAAAVPPGRAGRVRRRADAARDQVA